MHLINNGSSKQGASSMDTISCNSPDVWLRWPPTWGRLVHHHYFQPWCGCDGLFVMNDTSNAAFASSLLLVVCVVLGCASCALGSADVALWTWQEQLRRVLAAGWSKHLRESCFSRELAQPTALSTSSSRGIIITIAAAPVNMQSICRRADPSWCDGHDVMWWFGTWNFERWMDNFFDFFGRSSILCVEWQRK